jgi:hypothetical protein
MKNKSCFIFNFINFLLGYIHYARGIQTDNSIWLILYISYIISLNLFLTPFKAIARGFLVLFHIGIWSLSTIYHHLNLLCSPFPLPLVCSLHCTYLQSCLSLLIFKLMSRGVSQHFPTLGILYFGPFNPFHYSPLPIYLPSPCFNSFQYTSLYPLPSQMLYSTILVMIYHSLFVSLFPWVP